MKDLLKTDVAIIGAGPAGLFAVFQCGMLGLRAHVFDSLDQIGGQCTALYPEKPIYDIPAEPAILAGELIGQLEAQAAPFSPVYHLGQQVVSLSGEEGAFVLGTSKGIEIAARAVIIAGGSGSFGPNRPPLDGLAAYEGNSVFYAVRDKSRFSGKKVVIAGGGDSAVDWAIALADSAERVTLVHRRDKFRASAASLDRLDALAAAGRVSVLTPVQLSGIEGVDGLLRAVRVADFEGREQAIEADYLLPFYGLATELGPVASWGLDLSGHQVCVDPATAQSSTCGIYVIGDMATYPRKLRLILTGFAEAAQAAHHIAERIAPETVRHFEYSTTKGLPSHSG